MLKTADGLYVTIHEAALVNYPAMNLAVDGQTFSLSPHLVPDALGNKDYMQTPDRTPWRTVVVSDRAADILTSKLILNLNEPSKVADAKGVKLIMHHETSGSATNYERRMEAAYRFMKGHGYDAVKTGYVGRIIPRGEYHDGRWMVNHYNRVAEATARHLIMLDAHEPVRPTGLHRTYPNWLASEAGRGNEYNAWSEGNPPEHETILPFTRLMGGPMDYTPGIFQIKLDVYAAGKKEQVHTTLAKQLALYVTLYSPLQMAAELPENYERRLDAFQFIKDVAVDWDDTRVVEAEPCDYLTVARRAKGRDEWYVGAITDENARTSEVPPDFLGAGRRYVATVYADAPDAHWQSAPTKYQITSSVVDARDEDPPRARAGRGRRRRPEAGHGRRPEGAEAVRGTLKTPPELLPSRRGFCYS